MVIKNKVKYAKMLQPRGAPGDMMTKWNVVSWMGFQNRRSLTESKLVLLTAQQANTLRNELLGQGVVTLFGKTEDQEDGEVVSQRTDLPELEVRLFYTKRGRGCGWLLQISGCRNRLFLHLGSCIYVWSQCTINLQQDKCYFPFCSFLSLYKWKSVILLKVIALRMGYSVYFRL